MRSDSLKHAINYNLSNWMDSNMMSKFLTNASQQGRVREA